MLSQRELLDQLMGKDRNLVEEDKKVLNQHWYDENVCKYYICGFCPHDLFYNTKSDLGPCVKIHDEQLKQAFESEPTSRRTSYENAFLRLLQSLVDDVDRRKRRGTDRLTMQVQQDLNDPAYIERQKRVDEIRDQQIVLVDQMQELGEQGKVEEACAVLGLYDELEGKIRDIEGETDAGVKFITDHEKKMGVCDICGAFLVQNEAESRIQSHLNGKQHVGFSLIREKIEELKKELDERAAAPAAAEPSSNRDRSKQRSRSPRSNRRQPSRGSGDYRRRSRSPARRSSPPRRSSGNRHYEPSSSRRRSGDFDRGYRH